MNPEIDHPTPAAGTRFSHSADRDAAYERARRRVSRLVGWYRHAGIYLAVNGLVWGIFLFGSVAGGGLFDRPWPLPMSLGWGLGLLIHGLSVSSFARTRGRDWQRRKIEQFAVEELSGLR